MSDMSETNGSEIALNGTGIEIDTTAEMFELFTSRIGPLQALGIQLAVYDIVVVAFGVLVIVTNLLVVISSGLLLKKGQEPRCTYLLLGNVALADLTIAINAVLGSGLPKSLSTHTTCCIYLGTILSGGLVSIYSVALIAVDRFLYILHGLKYHRLVSITRVRTVIVVTWLLGLLTGFLPIMGWSGNSMDGKLCWFTMVATPKLFIFTVTVGILPILFVTILYSVILYNAIKKVVQLRGSGIEQDEIHDPSKLRVFRGGAIKNTQIKTLSEVVENANNKTVTNSRNDSIESLSSTSIACKVLNSYKKSKRGDLFNQPNTPTKWKAIKVVLFTNGSFICTWMPYFIGCTILVMCDVEKTPSVCRKLKYSYVSPLGFLCFLNAILNPIIYAWWNNAFRTSIKKLYWKRRKDTILMSNLKRSLARKVKTRDTQTSEHV